MMPVLTIHMSFPFVAEEEINSSNFYDLTEELINKDFNFKLGQRLAIMKIIKSKSQNTTEFIVSEEQTCNKVKGGVLDTGSKIPTNTMQPAVTEELICNEVIPGAVIDASIVLNVSDLEASPIMATVSESGALVLDSHSSDVPRAKHHKKSHKSKNKNKSIHQNQKDINVRSILSKSSEGREITDCILNNNTMKRKMRIAMLNILFQHCWKDFYPTTEMKVSLAKALVHPDNGFPSLGYSELVWFDETTSMGYIQGRLTKLREQELTPSRKRRTTSTTSGKGNARKKLKPVDESDAPSLTPKEVEEKKKWMGSTASNGPNYMDISKAMADTFTARRMWIEKEKPTTTSIVQHYGQFLQYNGLMISEEFTRMFPQHSYLLNDWGTIVPKILLHMKQKNKKIYDMSSCIKTDDLRALACLVEVTARSLHKGGEDSEEKQYIKRKKELLSAMPSCSLIQIAAEGEDVQYLQSKESEEARPIHPFIVWLSNDQETGEMYIKIDRYICINVKDKQGESTLSAALDILYKCHNTFNLCYHPYLKNFYALLDLLYACNTVGSIPQSIKNLKNLIS